MLKKVYAVKQIDNIIPFWLNNSFQEKFGQNLYAQNDNIKTYLQFWSKDQKIELLYTPYINKKKWTWGFLKSGFSFYERIVNKNVDLLQEKGYIFAPLTLTFTQNSISSNSFSSAFFYKEVFRSTKIRRYYSQLKSFFQATISDSNKESIKRIQNHILFKNLYKKFFFYFLLSKNITVLGYNFIQKYLHFYIKKKTNYLSYYKYKNRYHFKFFIQKNKKKELRLFKFINLENLNYLSKEKKIYTINLKTILKKIKQNTSVFLNKIIE